MVNQDLTQKTEAEVMLLEQAVLNPKQVSELSKVPAALVAWDAVHREYRDAGGETLSPNRQVGAIMQIIPNYVRQKGLWDFDNFKSKPDELRAWLKNKAKLFGTDTYAPAASKRIVNLLDSEELAQLTEDELHNLEDLEDGELNAFVRRRFGSKPGPGAAPRKEPIGQVPRRDAPPRDSADARCANCVEKGHTSRECPKPRIEPKDRPCFKCGKTGHQSRNCPAATGQAKALAEAPQQGGPQVVLSLQSTQATPRRPAAKKAVAATVFIGSFEEAGFTTVERRRGQPTTLARAPKPQPRACTIGGVHRQVLLRAQAHAAGRCSS